MIMFLFGIKHRETNELALIPYYLRKNKARSLEEEDCATKRTVTDRIRYVQPMNVTQCGKLRASLRDLDNIFGRIVVFGGTTKS